MYIVPYGSLEVNTLGFKSYWLNLINGLEGLLHSMICLILYSNLMFINTFMDRTSCVPIRYSILLSVKLFSTALHISDHV